MKHQLNSHYNNFKRDDNHISSDFNLIFVLLKDLLIFLIMLIPNIFMMLFYFFVNFEKSKEYFAKIFIEPFKLFGLISKWFFEAKITAYLIIFLYLMFFLQLLFFDSLGLTNALRTHPDHLFSLNIYTLITSVFIHGDIFHILSNSLALLIFGRIVEKQLGNMMIFIFLASGFISNVISHLISIFTGDLFYSLGASGAIAGLIIFAILIEPLAFTTIFLVPLPIFVIGWFLILLDIIGLTNPSTVNHYAHLGGYSALLVLFFFLEVKHRKKIVTGFSINLFMIILLYVLDYLFNLRDYVNGLL